MKRYVISPVVGNGISVATAFRSAASDANGAAAVDLIKANPETGIPIWNFAFSRVGVSGSFVSVSSISNSYVFPDFPLDAQMLQMEAETRSAMVQSVQSYDLDGNGTHVDATHTDSDSFRMVIEKIARQWSPSFNADQFDCPEGA